LQKIIILTAPSGSGKSSIAALLMQAIPQLQFSVSSATRKPRNGEVDGVHYHFISVEEFEKEIEQNNFVEWEKVYEGKYYGTTKKALEDIWQNKGIPLLDIDVKGALNLLQQFGSTQVCSIFIEVPLADLEKRLLARGTETPQTLAERLQKAEYEASFASQFQHIVLNHQLEQAAKETLQIVQNFLQMQ
jgi:guanylate kinase